MDDQDWLEEQLKTMRNLCEAGLIVHGLCRDDLMPTILEEILVEAQQAVDDFCVIKDK